MKKLIIVAVCACAAWGQGSLRYQTVKRTEAGAVSQNAETVVNEIVRATAFTGVDAGEKITAAIAALPANGGQRNGEVDARGFAASTATVQTLSGFTIPPGATVRLPSGTFSVTGTIVVNQGAHLICASPEMSSGTRLVAADWLNANVVEGVPVAGRLAGEYWEHASIENCYVNGNKDNQDNGNGVFVWQQSDNGILRNLTVEYTKNDGIGFSGSHPTDSGLENLYVTNAGGFGFKWENTNRVVVCRACAGDDNALGVFYFQGGTDSTLALLGLKAEEKLSDNTVNDPVITLDSIGGGQVPNAVIIGGYVDAGASGHTDFIRCITAPCRVNVQGVWVSALYANFINDTTATRTLPVSLGSKAPLVVYSGDGSSPLVAWNGPLLFRNTTTLNWTDSGGVAHPILGVTSGDWTTLDPPGSGKPIFLRDGAGQSHIKIDESGAQFTGSIYHDSPAFKHAKVAACTPAAGANSFCYVTVTWTTAFSGTNYTPVCSLYGSNVSGANIQLWGSTLAASVTVEVTNGPLGGTLSGAVIGCHAVMDTSY